MISSIFNELSVQIVSDLFPKPKPLQASQCQSPCTNQFQAFRSFLFSDFNHRAQNTNTNLTGICSFLFIQACLQANTNTNLTGILFPPFYPSLPSGKHKYKFNRHFVPSFSSQACLKANNNHSKHKCRHKANQGNYKNNRQQAEGIRRTSGPSNGPHSPCPPTIFQQSSNLQKLLHQKNSLSLLST